MGMDRVERKKNINTYEKELECTEGTVYIYIYMDILSIVKEFLPISIENIYCSSLFRYLRSVNEQTTENEQEISQFVIPLLIATRGIRFVFAF